MLNTVCTLLYIGLGNRYHCINHGENKTEVLSMTKREHNVSIYSPSKCICEGYEINVSKISTLHVHCNSTIHNNQDMEMI